MLPSIGKAIHFRLTLQEMWSDHSPVTNSPDSFRATFVLPEIERFGTNTVTEIDEASMLKTSSSPTEKSTIHHPGIKQH